MTGVAALLGLDGGSIKWLFLDTWLFYCRKFSKIIFF
jgi:hypothetical protein